MEKKLHIAFSRHLTAINDAYQRYFSKQREIDFVILDRPRWSDKGIQKYLYMMIHVLQCFWTFSVGKYDLIHINGPMMGLIAYLSSFFRGRYIYTNHGCPNPKMERKEGLMRAILSVIGDYLMKLSVKRAAHVYTISRYSQAELLKHYNIQADVIYNGINKDALCGKSSIAFKEQHKLIGKTVFISVGRMIIIKNPCLVIDVFCQLRQQINNAFLILIGDGNLWDKVHEHAKAKGLSSKDILIVRKIPFLDMGEWYANADYFISGNTEEPFGLAPLEAVACGCVPILPRSGGFPEIYEREKFFYNAEQLEHIKIPSVTEADRVFLEKLIARFTWDKAISEYEREYKKYGRSGQIDE